MKLESKSVERLVHFKKTYKIEMLGLEPTVALILQADHFRQGWEKIASESETMVLESLHELSLQYLCDHFIIIYYY